MAFVTLSALYQLVFLSSNGTVSGSSLSDCCVQCGDGASHVDFYSGDGTCYCSSLGEVRTRIMLEAGADL